MSKIFISQPMQDKSKVEILEERDKCVAYVQNLVTKLNSIFGSSDKVEVINSYFEDGPTSDVTNSGLWYLGKSLQLMATADIVVFAKGWRKARGCKIERKCAQDYNMTIIDYPGD